MALVARTQLRRSHKRFARVQQHSREREQEELVNNSFLFREEGAFVVLFHHTKASALYSNEHARSGRLSIKRAATRYAFPRLVNHPICGHSFTRQGQKAPCAEPIWVIIRIFRPWKMQPNKSYAARISMFEP